MAKTITSYVCAECGHPHTKWQGKCEACGTWNQLTRLSQPASGRNGVIGTITPGHPPTATAKLITLANELPAPERYASKLGEFDRVCGGGLVPGSVVLLAGNPGVGKSTLLLRLLATIGINRAKPLRILYICGEESPVQIQARAARLQAPSEQLNLTQEKDLLAIANLLAHETFDVIAVDSIQTVWRSDLDAIPGSVLQVRAATHFWGEEARKRQSVVILIGHVTKDGNIAGPKLMEHMVDVVLALEADSGQQFRLLRAYKNRYGSSDEVGIFTMTATGLIEVLNPSRLFISEQRQAIAGSAIYSGIEGTRPLMLEIQALVASSALPQPRRATVGYDPNRLAMILAVLERYLGMRFSGKDVYLNVTSGYRLNDPAADLAVAAALISADLDQALADDLVIVGEIGLGGEIRPVANLELRLKEADKLGFAQALTPNINRNQSAAAAVKINLRKLINIKQLHKIIADQ